MLSTDVKLSRTITVRLWPNGWTILNKGVPTPRSELRSSQVKMVESYMRLQHKGLWESTVVSG